MTARTVMIHGSNKVLAMVGEPGSFYRGKWRNVKITQIGMDEDVPLEVRRSLVGLVVPTIFTKEQLEKQIGATLPAPNGSLLAYVPDVIEVLNSAGRHEAAEQLKSVSFNPLDMYVIEKGIYERV